MSKRGRGDGVLNILVVRPDRIGDVILSTPVFEVLKRNYPSAKLTVMLRKEVVPLINGLPSVDEVMIFDPEGRHAGIGGLFSLISEIRVKKFRIAVVLQSHWRIAAALFAAGVRHRIGSLSKPHSFLFFNRGIRQRRSHVEMHEADYNLQLLRRLGIRVGSRNVPTRVAVSEDVKSQAKKWLMDKGFVCGANSPPLIVVHPAMAGSALNWPESHYIEFVKALIREGYQVLVTSGPSDGDCLDRIRKALGPELCEKVMFYGGPDVGPIDKLAGLITLASVVVAPSTGVMHLAVALGKPVVTFFSPIRVQSAIRWGPYLPDESKAGILVPDVYCGQDFECLGNLCNYYPCMKSTTVTQALEETRRHILHAGE